jgi:uncharacterized protein YyaL (SSP411 family)
MFLTPDGAPFFGGTYFPKAPRYGLPGFPDLCQRVAEAWRKSPRRHRPQQAAELRKALADGRRNPRRRLSMLTAAPAAAVEARSPAVYDADFGGFGGAPKFPHPTDLELLLRARPSGMCARRDGPAHAQVAWRRRHLRPARRRLLPLQRRRALGDSRISRKCSTTTVRCWRLYADAWAQSR